MKKPAGPGQVAEKSPRRTHARQWLRTCFRMPPDPASGNLSYHCALMRIRQCPGQQLEIESEVPVEVQRGVPEERGAAALPAVFRGPKPVVAAAPERSIRVLVPIRFEKARDRALVLCQRPAQRERISAPSGFDSAGEAKSKKQAIQRQALGVPGIETL